MPVFINTRPVIRANDLTHAIQSQNMDVLELPLLEMVSTPISDECINKVNDLIFDNYDVLVVVSSSAVEFAYKMATKGFSSRENLLERPLDNVFKKKLEIFQPIQKLLRLVSLRQKLLINMVFLQSSQK